tara:strand:+ start:913 stop:1434 length:522 start_codon:yes stop_codon:yes gene_type:complete
MKYDIINLDSFNPLEMKLIKSREKWYGKDDHSRWVFEDNGLFYKLWNETYVRRDNVKQGIDCGFYDETIVPSLVSLIYNEGICRGYVTKECKKHESDINSFYKKIEEKTKNTNFFVYDYTEKHVMDYNGEFSLIDLEGIVPLSEYDDVANDRFHASFASEKYRRFVCELYKNK